MPTIHTVTYILGCWNTTDINSFIYSFIHSFILETYIAPLQETTTQRRSYNPVTDKEEGLADSRPYMVIIGLRLFDDAPIPEMVCVKLSTCIHCIYENMVMVAYFQIPGYSSESHHSLHVCRVACVC